MAHGRRRSSTDDHQHRRFNLAHRIRPRVRTGSSSEPSPSQQSLDIRYLAIQFTERQGKYVPGHCSFLSQPNRFPVS
jgi:hypothetical protein